MEEHRHGNEEETYPVSPTGQYFNSSMLSISVLAILDIDVPIDDSPTMALLHDLFLPINPRFSSLMVRDKNGVKQWKKVEVKLKDHVKIPIFPPEKSPEFYDNCLDEYISKIAMDELPKNRPLWELHIIKYPTSNSAGNLIFKLHHALGDGFSLMGALLSCLQRAENPTLPLTFPTFQKNSNLESEKESICKKGTQFLSKIVDTISDFGWSLLKSSVVEDDRTPIRSAETGVEFRPITMTTITFSLDQIKEIKATLDVTINDVITGIIFFGTRLYMKEATNHKMINSNSTALVLLNTRNISGYRPVNEMVKPNIETKWGNQFGFLHVSIPELSLSESSNPLQFVMKAQEIIKRKRNSAAVYLTGSLLEMIRKYRGPEATAGYIHGTLKNSSMTISNMIGPVEHMALANHPIRGLYFMVVGVPQSLTITMMSYMGKLRVAVGAEKGFIDTQKFKSCIENAFDIMLKSATKNG